MTDRDEQTAVRFDDVETLSDGVFSLKRYVFDRIGFKGAAVSHDYEVFDLGPAVTVLLYDPNRHSVILTRQFRLPAYLDGVGDGLLVEAPAGKLEAGEDALEAVRREVEEETGYRIGVPVRLFDLFMSPGAVRERTTFYTAEVDATDRATAGVGLADEGEDIETFEVPFAEALAMVADGRIRDAKTVLLLQHAEIAGLFETP